MLRPLVAGLYAAAYAQDWSQQGNEGPYAGTQEAPMDALGSGGNAPMNGQYEKYGESPYKYNQTWFLEKTLDGKKMGIQQVWSDGSEVKFENDTGNAIPHANASITERFNKHWTRTFDGSGSGYGNMTKIKDENKTWTNGSAVCEGNGYLCVFPSDEIANRFGGLTPKDFNWFVVNYTHPLLPNNKTRVLDCLLHITHPHKKSETKPYYFHVPTGTRYFSEFNQGWCDLNAVHREINDGNQTLHDTIIVYGTTGQPPSAESEHGGLSGDTVEFTCGCETRLQTRASIGLGHNDGALLAVMEGTDQLREIVVQLWLYSDGELTDHIAEGATFPTSSAGGEPTQHFFFMARQLYKEDWTVQLQINKCMACFPGVECTFETATADEIVFYEKCAHVVGGPPGYPIKASSWYFNPSNDAIWSDDAPTRVPYHALGFAKFRMTGSLSMTVACRVTACSQRPCMPCTRSVDIGSPNSNAQLSNRRRLSSLLSPAPAKPVSRKLEAVTKGQRRLQTVDPGSETTASATVKLEAGDRWVPILGRNGQVDSESRKMSVVLLVIVLLLILVTAMVLTYRHHMRKLDQEAKRVMDEGGKQEAGQHRPQQNPLS